MKTAAIVQARMGSSRLPGKVLLDLDGKTVLQRVIERVLSSHLVEEVIVATTINREDLAIVKACAQMGIRVFSGSEADVLDRYYQVARLLECENVIRITADCPLIDPEVLGQIAAGHLESGADYSSNTIKVTYPDGLDVEVFKFKALKEAWQEARLLSEREHVTPFLRNHPERFQLKSVEYSEDHSSKRWTLDTAEDYEVLKIIYQRLYAHNPRFGMKDVLQLLQKNPGLAKANEHISRNEGYAKSLKEDKVIEV